MKDNSLRNSAAVSVGSQSKLRHVGIVFMRGNDLWIDSTPVCDAVNYGQLKTQEEGASRVLAGISGAELGTPG